MASPMSEQEQWTDIEARARRTLAVLDSARQEVIELAQMTEQMNRKVVEQARQVADVARFVAIAATVNAVLILTHLAIKYGWF